MKQNSPQTQNPVRWEVAQNIVEYPEALGRMKKIVAHIQEGTGPETVWLLEHPSVYTLGTSSVKSDLLNPGDTPVFETGRGGKITYHGPGQRVGYVMLNLKSREPDLRRYIWTLEELLIRVLAEFTVKAERRSGRIGLWVVNANQQEEKIAAIGVRIEKWVTYHGFALNVAPNLEYFKGIIPCGLKDFGVTSLEKLGIKSPLREIDAALKKHFFELF